MRLALSDDKLAWSNAKTQAWGLLINSDSDSANRSVVDDT